MRRALRAWRNHAALNAGVALLAAYHAALPPQADHSPEQVRSLGAGTAAGWFLRGLGRRT